MLVAVLGSLLGIFLLLQLLNYLGQLYFERNLKSPFWAVNVSESCGGSPSDVYAFVTGANSGLGLALTIELALAGVNVVMGCRNMVLGHAARRKVLAALENAGGISQATVQLHHVDVSDPVSCLNAAAWLKGNAYPLKYVFMNAGCVAHRGYRVSQFPELIYSSRRAHWFETSRPSEFSPSFLIQQPNETVSPRIPPTRSTSQRAVSSKPVGLQFATHVLGPYVLVQALQETLSECAARVIWTGSRAACRAMVEWDKDVGCVQSPDPYGATKYMQDVLSYVFNREWRAKGLRCKSFVGCPGVVITPVAPAVLHNQFIPFQWLMAAKYPNFQISPKRGVQVLLHLATSLTVETRKKYCMYHNTLGVVRNGVEDTKTWEEDSSMVLTAINNILLNVN